jgi:hypothetical protein
MPDCRNAGKREEKKGIREEGNGRAQSSLGLKQKRGLL